MEKKREKKKKKNLFEYKYGDREHKPTSDTKKLLLRYKISNRKKTRHPLINRLSSHDKYFFLDFLSYCRR